ncbi:hypothetical protein EXIGLDRAFT_733435 [Exidia glandulosa HHB12029]|uniref:GH16 domain-containing protein n=1 Tax=Exidia glandulosa HHB12029 TaxID=1314781 RepID=A0A165BAP5_EXIGL|nr:hypothetical protein EXIGLDRAFT_733435 [Exidia glandulosa HHB12029]
MCNFWRLVLLATLSAGAEAASIHKRSCSQSSTPTTPAPVPTIGPGADDNGGNSATSYQLNETWIGDKFYEGFTFYNGSSPTQGRVNYVDKDTALASNLSFTSSDAFVLAVDSVTTLDPSSTVGRNSTRIEGVHNYTTHAAVLDVRHMPEGMATWPAYWMMGGKWPEGGEFDIIEGVNDSPPNAMSLHTAVNSSCLLSNDTDSSLMKGTPDQKQCAWTIDNTGCGFKDTNSHSFGPAFNERGGGWYATERTPSSLKVWFWSRNDPKVPQDVREDSGTVSPSTWGLPTASFTSSSISCDISENFQPHRFIINIELCVSLTSMQAGAVFPGGPDACVKHVNENPDAFKDAYWDIARLSVYK